MHGSVDNHSQPITSIFCCKLMAMQRGDRWPTIFCFRICLFLLWLRFFRTLLLSRTNFLHVIKPYILAFSTRCTSPPHDRLGLHVLVVLMYQRPSP